MKIKLAESLYHGNEGYNCAQAILKAFQADYNISEQCIENASIKGSGRADNGICGALYATHLLLKEDAIINEINQNFIIKGGSVLCKEIRKNKTISCKECVRLAAHEIQKHLTI